MKRKGNVEDRKCYNKTCNIIVSLHPKIGKDIPKNNLLVEEKRCIVICDVQDGRPCDELQKKTRDKGNLHMLLLHIFCSFSYAFHLML